MGFSFIKGLQSSETETCVSLSKYTLIDVIGCGGFGKVWKIESKKDKKVFALKEISKARVITKRSVSSVMNEKQLLQSLNHPFLINIVSSFQDRDNLYLVMDLVTGGDLRYHLVHQTKFNEETTKFFIACTVIALEYLHINGIIHRDVKPQNLVFQKKGYLRLTDLGIAQLLKPQNSQDTSGTPGYMSPQVLTKSNHGVAADYYAVGIIMFECMFGRRPYNGKNRAQIRDQILSRQVLIKRNQLQEDWSQNAIDFCNKLIQRKPQSRLGNDGPQQIKSHPWFRGYPWQKLLKKQLKSPFIPHYQAQNYDQILPQVPDQNKLLLRRNSIQNLFKQYEFQNLNPVQYCERRSSIKIDQQR